MKKLTWKKQSESLYEATVPMKLGYSVDLRVVVSRHIDLGPTQWKVRTIPETFLTFNTKSDVKVKDAQREAERRLWCFADVIIRRLT